ncbi:hypothetical protein AK812_SmicGene48913, partial [Symbiodinium microadriaticum]
APSTGFKSHVRDDKETNAAAEPVGDPQRELAAPHDAPKLEVRCSA